MFEVKKNRINITRGTEGSITIKKEIPFKVGDEFKFSIVSKNDYKDIVFQKKYVVTEESQYFVIPIESNDTRFCPVISMPKTYWYELEYNDKHTIIGYDTDGAKEFVIYPEVPDRGEA